MSHIEHEGAYQRAIQRNIFQNARKTFNRVYPRAEEVASFLLSNTKNEFLNRDELFNGKFLTIGGNLGNSLTDENLLITSMAFKIYLGIPTAAILKK